MAAQLLIVCGWHTKNTPPFPPCTGRRMSILAPTGRASAKHCRPISERRARRCAPSRGPTAPARTRPPRGCSCAQPHDRTTGSTSGTTQCVRHHGQHQHPDCAITAMWPCSTLAGRIVQHRRAPQRMDAGACGVRAPRSATVTSPPANPSKSLPRFEHTRGAQASSTCAGPLSRRVFEPWARSLEHDHARPRRSARWRRAAASAERRDD